MKVFISYAHEDQARMLVIAEAVRAAGHAVEADVDILRGGDDFARRIETSIGACDVCVVLWSKASCSKPWVPAEANLGLQQKKRVISVKLEECSPPLPFSTFHMLDFSRVSVLDELLRSLDPAHVAAPPAKPSPWPMRLLGTAVAVAVLSVGAWLAIPALRGPAMTPTPVVTPQTAAPDASPGTGQPAATPQAAPDAGTARAKPSGSSTRAAPGAPTATCAATRASFERVQGDCHDPCDLDHYPMREDLDRCRACEDLRAKVQSCPR
jgi:TIR domain-containing protein